MWIAWWKYTKSGRSWTLVHTSGLFWARLVLTGSSIGLDAQICEWHDMQVWVGGSPANDEVSTDVWQ